VVSKEEGIGGPAQPLPAGGSRGAKAGERRWHGFGRLLPSFSRWVLSSNHWGHTRRQDELTDAIWASRPVVPPLLQITMYAPSLLPYAMGEFRAVSSCAA
jgi:hypothetical protein